MKRAIGYITLLAALLMSILLSGCLDEYGHEHTLSLYRDEKHHWLGCKDPKCDYVEDYSLHDYEWEILSEPGHLTEGKRKGKCKVCSNKTTEAIMREGHSMTLHERVEPTCIDYGSILYYECNICGDKFKDEKGYEAVSDRDILLGNTGHSFTLDGVLFTMPDADSAGFLKINCTKCGKTHSELEIPHYSDNPSFYEISVTPATCTDKGSKAYALNSYKIRIFLSELMLSESLKDSIYSNLSASGAFDTAFEIEIDCTPHCYEISYITAPTLDAEGEIKVNCIDCKQEFLPVIQGGNYTPALCDDSIYTLEYDTSSCEAAGVVSYSVNEFALRRLIIENYGLSNVSYVSVGNKTFSFDGQILGHKYSAEISHPTTAEAGSVCVRCAECGKALTETALDGFVIPAASNGEYFTSVLTASCTESGTLTYSYIADKIIDGFISTTGVTNSEYIAQIRALLTDIVYEVDALGHDYSSGKEVLTKLPTTTEEGIIIFPCDRTGCEHHRELADGVSNLKIPSLSSQSAHYTVKGNTATCSSAGIISLAIADGWYESQLAPYMSEEEILIYVGTDEVTPVLQNFEIPGTVLSHSLRYAITHDTMTVSCGYADCTAVSVVITLPQKTSSLYTKNEIASTCCEQGSCTYTLSYASACEIVSEYNDSLKNSYPNSLPENVAKRLNEKYSYTLPLELNSSNHPKDMIALDSTKETKFPEYNYTLNQTSSGIVYKVCNGCGAPLYVYFSYKDGVWVKRNFDGGFCRQYNVDGVIYNTPITYTWHYSVYYVGAPFIIHPTEINTLTTTYRDVILADCEEYNGKVATEVLVYIDGVLQTESSNRLSINDGGVRIYFGEIYKGDVYVKIIYK
ncbi:MAG: hypothetical protein IJY23_00030 [Clostridia bacterium]|nr:hypothetical protein [Clostridia bacterium]